MGGDHGAVFEKKIWFFTISQRFWMISMIPKIHTDGSGSLGKEVNGHARICCCSDPQLYLALHDPMDCSMPGFPVPHHPPEFAQVHVQCIGDASPTISFSVAPFFCLQPFPWENISQVKKGLGAGFVGSRGRMAAEHWGSNTPRKPYASAVRRFPHQWRPPESEEASRVGVHLFNPVEIDTMKEEDQEISESEVHASLTSLCTYAGVG